MFLYSNRKKKLNFAGNLRWRLLMPLFPFLIVWGHHQEGDTPR